MALFRVQGLGLKARSIQKTSVQESASGLAMFWNRSSGWASLEFGSPGRALA